MSSELLTGFVFALAAVALCCFAIKFVVRRVVGANFKGEDGPLIAWRILTARQLEMLFRESAPMLGRLLDRRDFSALAKEIRRINSRRLIDFERADSIDAVLDFLDRNQARPKEVTVEAISRALGEVAIMHADGPARYHPFDPPSGPVLVPAEYDQIASVLLSWPTQYPERWRAHAQLAALISHCATACVVVPNATWAAAVSISINAAGGKRDCVKFICAPNDDVWIRDFGPTLVRTSNGPAFVANPYTPNGLGFHKRDHELPIEIARVHGLPVHRVPLVIEGGNLVSDGAGRLFLTDSVFEHNADIDQAVLSEIMFKWYGASELTLLPALPGEITGHVDIALKLARGGGAWVTEAPRGHPWHDTLNEIAAIVSKTRAPTGSFYRVVRMPMAETAGGHSELCYCNALSLNGSILYPSYSAATDHYARQAFLALEPDARLHGVDFRDFRIGALHCQTKEIAQYE